MSNLIFKLPATKALVSDLKLSSDVPSDCKVYVFYVPGMIVYEELKKALEAFGESAGKNIFVGLWCLGAEPYTDVLDYFKIRKSPAVVISAQPVFSTDEKIFPVTAFARIDNPKILNNIALASSSINETCNLFLRGEVKGALSNARNDQYKATLNYYLGKLNEKISNFLKDHSVTFDIAKGQIILAPVSDSKSSA
jgi:hypothetical protein